MFPAEIFTDGSCHTQNRIGAWAAIIFIGEEKIVLTGNAADTTHNRMELTAVIKAIEFIHINHPPFTNIKIVSDSQYVIGLTVRKEKLSSLGFTNKKGAAIQNADLVIALLECCEKMNIEFVKIKAHQKKNEVVNYNIEADKLSRAIVREEVKKQQCLKDDLQ